MPALACQRVMVLFPSKCEHFKTSFQQIKNMKNQTTPSPETAAVLENQSAMKTTCAAIAKLEKAIGKCEAQIEEQQAVLPDLAPLLNQREDLLAAMAIGEDKKAEISKLDTKIAQLSAQQKDAKPALDALKQTIGGLQRRLLESQAELLKLQGEKSVLMRRFLNSRAEVLGAEYVAAASKMVELYKGLLALDTMLHDHGQGHRIGMHGQGLYVPRFMLDSMAGHADYVYPKAIFTSANHTMGHVQEWARQEKVKMLEIGVEVA